MSYLPIIERLRITGYGLYPGAARNQDLDVSFNPGLTVVLGANGLGKSTLINIIFRMLTGPRDVSLPEGSIGTASLNDEELNQRRRLEFSARVLDGAATAVATLNFRLGAQEFEVQRSLRDLNLVSCKLDDQEPLTKEPAFQHAVLTGAKVSKFGEWVFLLRTMVFFFEDRRMLVWDPAAQRQLLRCLLLEPGQAQAWFDAEREILQLDTRMRNLFSVLNREEKERHKVQRKVANESAVRALLTEAESKVRTFTTKREVLAKQLQDADQLRHRHRLDSLRADEALHASLHQVEQARLAAVETRFPSVDDSMRYIFSRLMSDAQCLVCGTPDRREKRDRLIAAIDHSACVLCDAALAPAVSAAQDGSESAEDISVARARVDETQTASHAARRALEESTSSFNEIAKVLSECSRQLADAEDDVNGLVKQLPPAEQIARDKDEGVNSLRIRVAELRALIKLKREQFAESMNGYRNHIRQFADGIKEEFDAAARGFLLEQSVLTWSSTRSYVGQSGSEGLSPIEFPGFAVEMTGANFSSVVRRDGPEQVSESQREFIDLAFRMALVKVASPDQCATIMIDAPESSLDAVFVNRAADVMARFANANASNRLILTSNLAAGKLVPAVLTKAVAEPSRRRDHIVDLFVLGEPTRAMQVLNDEYEVLRQELFSQLDPSVQAVGG